MARLCIIPARGGSKRIPKKNIKFFLGRPILSYAIETALISGLFDEVMVSTDSSEVAEVATKYGANVPFMRSETTAGDFATTLEVIKEVILTYHSQNKVFSEVCCLYPTAPLVQINDLQATLSNLVAHQLDCVFPVVKFSFPVQRGIILNGDLISPVNPEFVNLRSQDLEPVYHDAGQFYWVSPNQIMSKDTLWTEKTGYIVLDELRVQDIDTETDWKLAELKYQLLNK